MERIIKTLCVFDFDGTLIDTPLPEDGKPIFLEKTGKQWPHEGWWSRKESLDHTIFDMSVIEDTREAYERERQSPNTYLVMMTGRIARLSKHVEEILTLKGFTFDRYIYNYGGNTLDSKLASLDSLVAEFKGLTTIKAWDDRQKHIPHFRAWGEKLKGINFEMNVVDGNYHKK